MISQTGVESSVMPARPSKRNREPASGIQLPPQSLQNGSSTTTEQKLGGENPHQEAGHPETNRAYAAMMTWKRYSDGQKRNNGAVDEHRTYIEPV